MMQRAMIALLLGILAEVLTPEPPERVPPPAVDGEPGEASPSPGERAGSEHAQRREKGTPPVYEETARHPTANAPQ